MQDCRRVGRDLFTDELRETPGQSNRPRICSLSAERATRRSAVVVEARIFRVICVKSVQGAVVAWLRRPDALSPSIWWCANRHMLGQKA